MDDRSEDIMDEGIIGFLSEETPMVSEETTQGFTPSKCSCELCNKINTVNHLWSRWEPSTPMEHILKKAIDKITTTMS